MGDEPPGPNAAEPRTTKRSSEVGSMTSFRRTPPPQVQMSARGEEQRTLSSVSASKPPTRLPKVRMSKLSPFASVKPLVRLMLRRPSSVVTLVTVYASAPTTLVSFNGSDGNGPYAGLIADANGDLFGTT